MVRRGNMPHASKVTRDEERRQLFVDFVNASRVSASATVIGFKRHTFAAGLFRANSKIASDEAVTGQLYRLGTWHARPVTWTS